MTPLVRTPPRWTLSVLTIPKREAYLAQLLASLGDARLPRGTVVDVVYNWDTRERPHDVVRRLRKAPRGLEVNIHFNTQRPTIGSGRIQQLNHCKTPLLAINDDVVTVHGDLLGVLEERLQRLPVGIVGVQSLVEGSDRRFKPRRSTPHVDARGFRFMPVQGMLVAGYRRLFLDIGGFNPRREFWGEWTEFNLRMWRSGFPTGYAMNGAYPRHWEKAPESPTRNMSGREDHVMWGLLCTALEYDAVDEREDTRAFWNLVESRYLAYAFGSDAPKRDLMRSALRLAPRLSAEYPAIATFRDRVREHPFPFMPFHQFSADDVARVLAHAETRIAEYRDDVWDSRRTRAVRWVRRQLAAV
ncbi:MAG TPA: glycosyltransferase [Gemmatimonadaceae bacterium]|nr:glycosyltransferase [Gemmatimonadaceae bacterium]